jgi:hypothetical protein
MSDTDVMTWTIDIDPHEWIAVPAAPLGDSPWRADATAVFEELLEVEREGDDDHLIGDDLDVELAVDTLLEFSAALDGDLLLVAGLGLVGEWPLPVIVDVRATELDPGDLLDAAGARGGLPVDAPTVDDVASGDGIRVTRLDLDDAGAVWAHVACARRRDGADVVLTWRTSRLELVPRFSPLLEDLLAHVTIETKA